MESTFGFFCSELSRQAEESSCGTASIGTVWLLLEYPHRWDRNALEESALSGGVKAHVTRALAEIRNSRVLFLKTDRGRRDARMNFFIVRCREQSPFVVRFRLENYDDLTKLDLAAVVSRRDLQGGAFSTEPLFLVCTHGRRDKCCAKFGIPLFNDLHAFAGDSVWQSSHVGGDRFAGNLVCFPHGLFYAHTSVEAGRRIVEEYKQGGIISQNLRGRACYAHHTQAAEYFARCEFQLKGIDDLRFLSSRQEGQKSWTVRFGHAALGRVYRVRVSCRLSDFQNFTTCHSETRKPVSQFFLENLIVSDGRTPN